MQNDECRITYRCWVHFILHSAFIILHFPYLLTPPVLLGFLSQEEFECAHIACNRGGGGFVKILKGRCEWPPDAARPSPRGKGKVEPK